MMLRRGVGGGSVSSCGTRAAVWAERSAEKERGKSAAEQSLDLLRGTSTALVDSGDDG